MRSFKNFETHLWEINEKNFDDIALELFELQASENTVYKNYLTHLGVNPRHVNTIDKIPFLPISFFKEHQIVTGEWIPESVFSSSGTTGTTTSKHPVHSLDFYLENTKRIFELMYGPLSDFHILALLPSYQQREGSSLVAMVDYFIRESGSKLSSFFLHDFDALLSTIDEAKKSDRRTLLIGVSHALLDVAERGQFDLNQCIIMETGGMKGRRMEITRQELHSVLSDRFNVTDIHSEYGMTELLSQAYAPSKGYFKTAPGMKVLIRDINDPFEILGPNRVGGINVIDLANIRTCAFVETQDLGRMGQDGNFEVLGRIDNSDVRGCNLLVE